MTAIIKIEEGEFTPKIIKTYREDTK